MILLKKPQDRATDPDTGVQLTITCLMGLRDAIRRTRPDLVISISDPDPESVSMVDRALAGYQGQVCRLVFHDVDRLFPGCVSPTPEGVRPAVLAMRDLSAGHHVLLHCHAGLSRSPALAILGMAAIRQCHDRFDARGCEEIIRQVIAAAPLAMPNPRLLAIGEHLLGLPHGQLAGIGRSVRERTAPRPARRAGIW